MFARWHVISGKHLFVSPKFWVGFVIITLILTNITIVSLGESSEGDGMHSSNEIINASGKTRSEERGTKDQTGSGPRAPGNGPRAPGNGPRAPGNGHRAPDAGPRATGSDTHSRSAMSLGFTEISSGLPSKGDFSYVALADFNKDSDIDIAFGSEDWDVQDSQGLYAFTGNGGTSWSNSTDYLWQGNSWGGLQLADADEDGAMELYATDEDWGSKNNSGVHAWEFRNGKWTDNSAYVSTPESSGQPCNVILTNVTGDSRLDMLVNRFSGIRYYENTGGNPATWQQKSTGLATNNWYTGAALGDLNKDGLKDLVSTRNDQERMWIQSTSGNLWQEYSSGITTNGYMVGVAIADVNADGHNDIIFGTSTPSDGYGIKVWLGNSGGSGGKSFTWTDGSTGLPTLRRYSQIQLVDIDNDGDLDIVGPCSSKSEGMHIFLGNGSEKPGMDLGWTKATNIGLPVSGNWYGANTYDINGDGSLDLVGASWGMGVRAWLNNISSDKTSPAAVTDLTVTDVTTDSITVKWTAPADNGTDAASGPAQSYDIRYYTSMLNQGTWGSAVECASEPVPAQPGTEQSYIITGLSPATFYYIGLRSSDEMPNISPISNIVSDTTLGLLDDTLPGQINDLAASEPTNNSIKLTWTAPADNGTDASSGPVAEYDIRYYSFGITNANWATAEKIAVTPQPSTPGSTETFIATGLIAETTYYFAVKSRDERPNWSLLSNSPHETTLVDPDESAPDQITDLKTQNPTTTSLELTWTAPGDDGDIGTASTYELRYAETSIDETSWSSATEVSGLAAPKGPGETEVLEVTSLNPQTVYYFAIKTADEIPLWSPLSNVAIGTTLAVPDETAPSKITDLAATEPTAATVKLTWTAPGDDEDAGTVAAYDIRYSKADITDSNWDAASVVSGPPVPQDAGLAESFKVSGLEIDTTYYFAVRSVDEVPNWSPLSNIASAKTLATPELDVEITPEKTVLNSSESIILYIQVTDVSTGSTLESVSIDLIVDNSDVILSSASGETDAEGLLMISLTAPSVSENTKVEIQVGAQKLGYETGTASVALTINKIVKDLKFDLEFQTLDDPIPDVKAGDDITIKAIVINNGPAPSTDFIVRVYLDDKKYGDDHSFPSLKSAGDQIVEVAWQAEAGVHEFRFEVIPADPDQESDPGDNEITVTYTIDVIEDEKPDDSGYSSNVGANTLTLISIAVIIIIITMIILLFIISRGGKKKEYAGGYGVYAPVGEMDETDELDTAEEESGGEDLEE